jgi:hypothetical protein
MKDELRNDAVRDPAQPGLDVRLQPLAAHVHSGCPTLSVPSALAGDAPNHAPLPQIDELHLLT